VTKYHGIFTCCSIFVLFLYYRLYDSSVCDSAHTITIDLLNKSVRVADKDIYGNALPDINDIKNGGSLTSSSSSWSSSPQQQGSMSSGMAGSIPAERKAHDSHYYTNDTLTGRAKKMYEDLKESLRQSPDVINLNSLLFNIPSLWIFI
jgi:hypothetical protein